MAARRYKPQCRLCGQIGSARNHGTPTGGVPNATPNVSGKCKASPTGRHAPMWVPE